MQEQRQTLYKCCRHHHFSATIPQNQFVVAADAMTLVKVLHQLVTFPDAMSPVKGLHELVTLAFISVTYFCFENKLVWKLTPSPSPPFTIKKHL